MSIFRLPDLGEGLQEAEIVAWSVGPGDHVVAEQPLVSVETDKAVVEIPSPHAGRIAKLHGKPGEIVPIGAPLVEFEGGESADTGTVVGELDTGAASAAPLRPAAATTPGLRVAPALRRLAQDLGVDLGTVRPTGPEGTLTRADIEAAVGAPGAGAGGRAEPLRGVRRAMARNMTRSHASIVPATVTDEADIGAWAQGQDATIRLVRAIVAGCGAEPALNAHFLGEEQGRTLHERIDLGIATDTPDGLFVPVLRDVGNRDAADLRRGLDAMKADVRKRSIPRAELVGQTITLSNFGMFGGRHAQLVVLPPQVAILGAGRMSEAVRVRAGAPAVTRVLPLSLTFDHRAVMGGEAARFLASVIADLERPD
jgi:pyruvate dehydrogenase E2 component (dihydrolipoamide acetyltransferase)